MTKRGFLLLSSMKPRKFGIGEAERDAIDALSGRPTR